MYVLRINHLHLSKSFIIFGQSYCLGVLQKASSTSSVTLVSWAPYCSTRRYAPIYFYTYRSIDEIPKCHSSVTGQQVLTRKHQIFKKNGWIFTSARMLHFCKPPLLFVRFQLFSYSQVSIACARFLPSFFCSNVFLLEKKTEKAGDLPRITELFFNKKISTHGTKWAKKYNKF